MYIKYYIQYNDITGVQHRLNIYEAEGEVRGTPNRIDGRIFLGYSETDDPLEAIRGSGLRVELEANSGLTFSDLWSEEEKTYRVEYKRDGVILFQGWLNPEGFFEDFVSTDWIVSFDCVDGLGYLSDLSFVDSDGYNITGKQTFLYIISKALARTGLELNINIDVQIRYDGLSDSVNIMENARANTVRFFKDDGETIMSCEEVLRGSLEIFGACITSRNGEWYIYKPNQLFLDQTAVFSKYTYLGVQITGTFNLDTSETIGSHIDDASIIHCSGNQSLTNKSSLGAYRINYKYGKITAINKNPDLVSWDHLTMDGWTIVEYSGINLSAPGLGGVTHETQDPLQEHFYSDPVSVPIDVALAVSFNIDSERDDGEIIVQPNTPLNLHYHFRVYVYNDYSTVYLGNNMEWVAAPIPELWYAVKSGNQTVELTTAPIPIAGNVVIQSWGITHNEPTDPTEILLNSLKVSVSGDAGVVSMREGEFHTFQREDKPSSKTKDVKKVYTGDNDGGIYDGSLFEFQEDIPTLLWERKDVVESKSILQIMGEERMRISQLPARVFSGNVYGYYDYLSVITISDVTGLFMPIKYEYDTKNNIIEAELIQIYGAEVTDIEYTKTYDYGNTVKPTIKG